MLFALQTSSAVTYEQLTANHKNQTNHKRHHRPAPALSSTRYYPPNHNIHPYRRRSRSRCYHRQRKR